MEFTQAIAYLDKASELQPIWYSEFGLEVKDQLMHVVQEALATARSLQFAETSQRPHEMWWRGILEVWEKILGLCEQIHASGQYVVEPGSALFAEVVPSLEAVLSSFRQLDNDSTAIVGFRQKFAKPGKLDQLERHLAAAKAENDNMAVLKSILHTDEIRTYCDDAGRFCIKVFHRAPVAGFNYDPADYEVYGLRLIEFMNAKKMTSLR